MGPALTIRDRYAAQLREGFDFHGHLDGFCFRYGGHVVEVWPTETGAVRGMTLAKEALRMLERTLAQPLMNTQRKAA